LQERAPGAKLLFYKLFLFQIEGVPGSKGMPFILISPPDFCILSVFYFGIIFSGKNEV
jgi:hypothetical protein